MNAELLTALRQLLRRPLFLLLGASALGIGLAAAMLVVAILNTLLWRDLPGVGTPQRQVEIGRLTEGNGFDSVGYSDFVDLRQRMDAFDGVYAWKLTGAYLGNGGDNQHALVQLVSGDYFSALGVATSQGRLFGPAEADTVGREPVLVASHAAWLKHFNGDPAAIGRTLRLNGSEFTLIGVTAPAFRGHVAALQPEFYAPLGMAPALRVAAASMFSWRDGHWLYLGGRLREGHSLAQANQALAAFSTQLRESHPDSHRRYDFSAVALRPLPEAVRAEVSALAGGLLLLCGAVLALACSNLAGVMLARGEARMGELAMRITLGASRGRIARQLLLESALIAASATAVAAFCAGFAQSLWLGMPLPLPFPLDLSLALGAPVFLFAFAASIAVALGCGLLPALRVSAEAQSRQLGRLGGGAGGGRQRLRHLLLALQSALTVMLLVIAGLSLRSLQEAAAIDTGFATDQVYTAPLDLTPLGLEGEAAAQALERVATALRGQSGVETVSYATVVPLSNAREGFGYARPAGAADTLLDVDVNTVGSDFFRTFGITVQGRALSSADTAQAERVSVINRSFARQLFGAADPIGREFEIGDEGDWTRVRVVGLVEDGRYADLQDRDTPFAFFAAAQWAQSDYHLLLRGPGDYLALQARVSEVVRAELPDLPRPPLHRFEQIIALSILPQRLVGLVSAVLGGLALLLAGTGLYGLLALQIERRQREFGVRRALGAGSRQIAADLLRRSSLVVLVGAGIGLLLAQLAALAMQSLLLGVGGLDPLAVGSVLLAFATMLGLAGGLPLQRALRLPPMEALRHD